VTAPFATRLLGWKTSSKNKLGWALVPNFADVDNAESLRLAAGFWTRSAWPAMSPRTCPLIREGRWSVRCVIILLMRSRPGTRIVAGR
jgi:hypothetical protein